MQGIAVPNWNGALSLQQYPVKALSHVAAIGNSVRGAVADEAIDGQPTRRLNLVGGLNQINNSGRRADLQGEKLIGKGRRRKERSLGENDY